LVSILHVLKDLTSVECEVVAINLLGSEGLLGGALVVNVHGVAFGVPVLLVEVHTSSNILGCLIVSEVCLQVGGVGIKVHLAEDTLSEGQVRAGQCLDLVVLEGAVLVPEALRADASRSSEIGIGLELPVSPSNEVIIGSVTDLVDFLGAGSFSEAGTKFGDDKRDTEALRVFSSLPDSLLVPLTADAGVLNLWLTSKALVEAELAAVCVVVEDVHIGANFATWRGLESNWEDQAFQDSSLIGERNRLEPHLLGVVIGLILVVDLLVHGGQVFLVHAAWDQEHGVAGRIRGEWLVKRIVAYDERIAGKSGGDVVPVANESVLKAIFVGEKSIESLHRLLCHVVLVEVT
jgi:hypothetical protein